MSAVNLTQPRIRGRKVLSEKLSRSGWPEDMSVGDRLDC